MRDEDETVCTDVFVGRSLFEIRGGSGGFYNRAIREYCWRVYLTNHGEVGHLDYTVYV